MNSVYFNQKTATLTAAILVGIGFMAAIDEIVFHQILGWHHFVQFDSSALALASDGLLHTMELVMLAIGGGLLLRLYEVGVNARGYASAGLFFGMGGFQLFDGIIVHKILKLHQIRYVSDVLYYDIAWNVSGLLLLTIGGFLLLRAKKLPVIKK